MKNQTELQKIYRSAGIDFELRPYPNFPGPIYTLAVPGGEAAIELWQKIRDLHAQTGYWPVLTENYWYEELADELNSEHWLAAAQAIDAKKWFDERREDLPNPEEEAEEWREMMEDMGLDPDDTGQEPVSAPARFSTPYDILTQEPLPELVLTLIPAQFGWQAAAYLGFGDWNACPEPAVQVAIQKYWYETFAAELVAMTASVVEMKVLNPPQTDEDALALAQEQYLFCDDIVHQGCQTVDNLKQTLLKSSHWYFWWD